MIITTGERVDRINRAKRQSYIDEVQLVVEDEKSREFFRFQEGRVIEYDRTKSNGVPLRLREEEVSGDEEFPYIPL